MDQKNVPKGDRPDASLAPELQRKLQAASQQHHLSLGALHEAICAYLDEFRMTGMSRKDAFDTVRLFIAQDRGASGSPKPRVSDRLLAQVAVWCEEHWRETA